MSSVLLQDVLGSSIDTVTKGKQINVRHECRFESMAIYFRVTRRVLVPSCLAADIKAHKLELCIDLARLDVPLNYQRTGIFNRLIAYIFSQSNLPIWVENIQDRGWYNHLRDKGWISAMGHESSVYRRKAQTVFMPKYWGGEYGGPNDWGVYANRQDPCITQPKLMFMTHSQESAIRVADVLNNERVITYVGG